MRRALTDADLAALASAEPELSTVELARALAKPYFTVAHARQRIRRMGGWFTPIVLGSCSECGGPVITSPGRPRAAHPTCRGTRAARYSRTRRAEGWGPKSTPYVARWRRREPERAQELREHEKIRLRELWPDLPVEARAASLARAHDADARDYPLTLQLAENSRGRWTSDEDHYVLAHLGVPARDVALALGRTLWAVRTRRVHLGRQLQPRSSESPRSGDGQPRAPRLASGPAPRS